MNGIDQISAGNGTLLTGTPLTRPQRQELLRLLHLGRGLERELERLRDPRRVDRPGASEAVLAAIAAAAGLQPGDRLIAPHALLAAHLAGGIAVADIAKARLGDRRRPAGAGMIAAIGPQSPAGIAVGVAHVLGCAGADDTAVALVDRRWADEPDCRGALALARELRLALVVVAIDSGEGEERDDSGVVDRRDFEAVRLAVAVAIEAAHADRCPVLVVCAPSSGGLSRAEGHVARFQTRVGDPLTGYERALMVNGFARAELDAIRHDAARRLERVLTPTIAAAGRIA